MFGIEWLTPTLLAVGVLAAVALVEAVVLAVLTRRLHRTRAEADELRQRVDTRNLLLTGGREAVKTVWQTANLVRKQGSARRCGLRSKISPIGPRWSDPTWPASPRTATW